MTDQENIDRIRKRFIERTGNAFFQAWAGLGLKGEKYSFGQAAIIAANLFDSTVVEDRGDGVSGD